MYILGTSFFYHDSAAALIQDGELIAAADQERFSRKKHDSGFPSQAIAFCLAQAGIAADDLDYVVFYEKPLTKFERILMTSLGTFPRSWESFSEAMVTWFDQKLWIKTLIQEKVGVPADKVLFTDHHMSHAASALFCSPYEQAAIMTVDGVGEWTTMTLGQGRASWQNGADNEITLFSEQRFPHSIGLLYSAFTAFLGFKVNNGEYKVMGMAPYGQPKYLDQVYKILKVQGDSSFSLDMDYLSYHYSPTKSFNSRFVQLFGEPRVPESEFFTVDTDPDLDPDDPAVKKNQHYADVAASIQRATEDTLLKMANYLYEKTGLDKLCMAGGVALNSVANGRILRETPFQEVFIQPAAGDSGGALGAALYVYHVLLKKPRAFVMEHAYWGQGYTQDEIRSWLERNSVAYTYVADDVALCAQLADELEQGKVIGWFQGRFEWGPRALGNRSILADPRRADMKHIVNEKIKFRELFRPFAPAVLEERSGEFYGVSAPEQHYPPRYMLMVFAVPEDKQAIVPATTHQGGTARIQTVRREWNPLYYDIIAAFHERTGVPVLLNTSFNLRGEPIVDSPADAFKTFSNSGIDTLMLDHFLIQE
ncbi:MAG: carbamoyltransferase [Anaerolineae bacterium]|nr:carbamoyltransferase [Anaerolineae bacterium]